MTNILITGDTCPIGRNQSLFQQADASALLGDLLPEFEQADLSIVNLECPLIQSKMPIDKCGPNLSAPVDCVNGLKAMGVDVVGLANNHIMDHGPQGLQSTTLALDANNIAHVGAGENLQEARKILVREVHGMRVGILAVAEHEFGIATRNATGANPLDVIDCVRNINEHRYEYDYLIVLLHGGNEHYQYPRPSLMDICRFLVEQGANAVICQHSHCAGCMETYRGAPIVYGQGNFIFDYPIKTVTWHQGVLVTLVVDAESDTQVELIPYIQSDAQPGARRMPPNQEEKFLHDFHERSESIKDESFIEAQWESFCREHKRHYLHLLHGKPGLFRRVMGKLNLLHYLDSREKQMKRLNLISCESHREAIITVLTREVE